MNLLRRSLGLGLGSILAAASLWACTATSNGDGSVTIEFAPDMTITAWGLENALDDLTDLLTDCITGNFARPCTEDEMDEIVDAIGKVLDRKGRMGEPEPPSPGGSFGA